MSFRKQFASCGLLGEDFRNTSLSLKVENAWGHPLVQCLRRGAAGSVGCSQTKVRGQISAFGGNGRFQGRNVKLRQKIYIFSVLCRVRVVLLL